MKTSTLLPTISAGLFALALTLSPLSAQDAAAGKPDKGQGRGATPEQRVAKMKESLSLTDDQVAKIKAIYEEQKTKIDPIRQDTSLTREQQREKTKPIMDETKTQVDAILTPEQKAKAEQLRAERESKRQKKDQ